MITEAPRLALTEILEHPSSTATGIHVAVLDRIGTAIYEYDPLTLWLEIKNELGLELPEVNQDKLQGLITAVSTDAYYKTVEGFMAVASVMAHGDGGFTVFDPPTVADVLWSIYEVALNRDPEPFSPSVKALIKQLLAQEGNSGAPEAFLQASGDSTASDDTESQLDQFLKGRAADVRADLIKLRGEIPDLPNIEDILDPVLSQL